MEANEAPEKLYCVATEGGYYLTTNKPESPFAEAVEYTRTDAFIEKTCLILKDISCPFEIIEQFKNRIR